MPAKVKVRILAGRNLPVMDKSSDASDAFVEVKLGNTTYKTEVYRRSLNPFWNSEWFRFEVSDQELQDEPLQIRIMDYDTYSANDAIGKVYINLNPLLVNPGRSMSGWLPIYDTLHGIRGEINCMVKVNLFADNNRYRHSSCGVRFFFSDIPNGYKCDAILGFVDELLVNDDPEYQWIDKIRTPRASNEARQTLFTKLSGEVQRKLGLKAEIFGGNAVIGYQQSFDLEGGSGIVGRGIGTAVVLSKIGFPYEGIISPLHVQHAPYPYCLDNRISTSAAPTSGQNVAGNRSSSNRQSLTIYKKMNPNKQLVHSISADYFYEVPNLKAIRNNSNDSSEDNSQELYLDCRDEFAPNESQDDLTNVSKAASNVNESSVTVNDDQFEKATLSHKTRRFRNFLKTPLTHKLSYRSKVKPNDDIGEPITAQMRRSKADFLIKKLQNANVGQKLVGAIAMEPPNLTKLLSFSPSTTNRPKPSTSWQDAKANQAKQFLSIEDTGEHLDLDDIVKKPTASGESKPPHQAYNKRRRDKSQSNSIDDGLSVIEEKLDDDSQEHSQLNPGLGQLQASRSRLLSNSSSVRSGQRQITRAKEIDLNDDSESTSDYHHYQGRSKGFSLSSADDDDLGENSNTLNDSSASTVLDNSKEVPLSSSSPSTSLLTDETIKEVKLGAGVVKLARYDTDSQLDSLKHDDSIEVEGPIAGTQNKLASSTFSRSDSTSQSQSLDTKSSSQNTQQKLKPTNFVQSVRAVKAQQHLLQNMIKHQNQNLLANSDLRARNAFMYPNRVHQSEYPFVTLKRYPENMIQSTGGVVSVHSVKLLDHIINDEESETRDIWWTEIRKEIRSHAKALNCNTILGYSETSKVLGDVCILSACGTAAVMKQVSDQQQHHHHQEQQHFQTLKVPRLSNNSPPLTSQSPVDKPTDLNASLEDSSDAKQSIGRDANELDCSFCHTPLACVESISSLPSCTICKSSKVPDILLLTIEPPHNLNIVSQGSLVQARVCRTKRDLHGEASAKEIGDALPFLEYELHRQLFGKLKFKGMNCLFNLSIDISVGENMMTGIATGTGCFVLGLPTPDPPQISAGKGIKTSRLQEIQRLILLSAQKNRDQLGLDHINAQLSLYHQQVEKNSKKLSSLPCEASASSKHQQHEVCTNPSSPSRSPPNLVAQMLATNEISHSESGETGPSNRRSKSSSSKHHKHYHHHHQHHYHQLHQSSKLDRNMLAPAENLINLLSDENSIVLEVDDNEDADIIALLIDSDVPEGYLICNSESIPGAHPSAVTSINMFTQVMRAKLGSLDQFAQQFDWILQSLFVKLRRSLPCCLTNISFVVDLPESQVIQISVTGCLLGLRSTSCFEQPADGTLVTSQTDTQPGSTSSSLSAGSTSSSSSPTNSSLALPTSAQSSSSKSSSSSSLVQAQQRKSAKTSKKTAEQPLLGSRPSATPKESSIIKASLPKQLSKTNLAALFRGSGHQDKVKTPKVDEIEMSIGGFQQENLKEEPLATTKQTIAAVKQEIEHNRLGGSSQPQFAATNVSTTTASKAIFKKQQTYPGAISPQISGQDRHLVQSGANNQAEGGSVAQVPQPTPTMATTLSPTASSAINAARRATLLLNKVVKQPLKELGSNFNSQPSTQVSSSSPEPVASTSAVIAGPVVKSTPKLGGVASSLLGKSSKAIKQQPAQQTELGAIEAVAAVEAAALAASDQAMSFMAAKKLNSERTTNSSIDITSLSYIPGAKEYHYLGNLSFSFVRETNSVRENGGLNGFIHCFLMEVYAIVRAHVSALGGNAFLSFRLQQSCIFYHSNKNQAQCLISVAGDAVQVNL